MITGLSWLDEKGRERGSEAGDENRWEKEVRRGNDDILIKRGRAGAIVKQDISHSLTGRIVGNN